MSDLFQYQGGVKTLESGEVVTPESWQPVSRTPRIVKRLSVAVLSGSFVLGEVALNTGYDGTPVQQSQVVRRITPQRGSSSLVLTSELAVVDDGVPCMVEGQRLIALKSRPGFLFIDPHTYAAPTDDGGPLSVDVPRRAVIRVRQGYYTSDIHSGASSLPFAAGIPDLQIQSVGERLSIASVSERITIQPVPERLEIKDI